MHRFSLFPEFPRIEDTPPTLKSIRSSSRIFLVGVYGALLVSLFFWEPYIPLRDFLHSYVLYTAFLLFSVSFTLVPFAYSLSVLLVDFRTIHDTSFCGWSNSSIAHFFEEHPELSHYREDVMSQKRPFFVGEMKQLSKEFSHDVLHSEDRMTLLGL